MKNTKQLYQLIQKLKKSEKRHFKLFVKRYKAEEDTKSIKLFDLLSKMAEYEEEQLLEIYDKKQLNYDLFKLKNLLLNSLSDLHFKNNAESPGEIINRIELGFKYEDSSLIEDSLKKGYALAEQTENTAFRLHLLQYESSLGTLQQNTVNLIDIDKKIRNHSQTYNQTISYHQMWLEVLKWFDENYFKTPHNPLMFSSPLLTNLYNSPPSKDLNFEAKAHYLKARALYFTMVKDHQASLQINEELLTVYLNSPKRPQDLLPVLYNVVLYNLQIGNVKKAEQIFERTDLLNQPIVKDKNRIQRFHSMILSLILSKKEAYNEIVDMESKVEQFYQDEQKQIAKKENQAFEQCVYFLVIALFKEQQYSKCLDWILKVNDLNNKRKQEQSGRLTAFQFIELFSHLELNNKRLIPSLIKSIEYTLKIQKSGYQFQEAELVQVAKSLIKGVPHEINYNLFTETKLLGYSQIFLPYLKEKQKQLNAAKNPS